MKKLTSPNIKLVITIALKKEVPKHWLASRNVPVHTLAALKAGALKGDHGMLVVITGAGLDAAGEAAQWILENLDPLFVLNIGTCGIRSLPLGEWIRPCSVSDENGKSIELDTRLPLPDIGKVVEAGSLLSLNRVMGSIPEEHDAVDMECFAQAEKFAGTGISFHCLKFSTDHSDASTIEDFNNNIELFPDEVKRLFSFLDMTTEISVVIPVYNREQAVRRAVDSVLSQSVLPKEIIVVDDCSTDNTPKALEEYGERIRVIRLRENSGPSKARNEGVKQAKAEWIAFLDSDDRWEKDKLANQIEYLRKYPFYRIIQTDEKWIRNGKRVNPRDHHKKPEGWIWELSLERCLVSPPGVLINRALFERFGMFDETMPVCEDYDLWLRISRHLPVGLDPVLSVLKYGGHADQLSTKYPAMDRFRAESLYRLLRDEPSLAFRQKIINVLEKKLNILIKGYEKRNRTEDKQVCERMLESLDEYEKESSVVKG